MDKYQKMAVGFLIFGVFAVLIFVFVVYNGSTPGGSSSDDTSFPFFIFFPSWIAIFVPLIARQRREAKLKQEELRNRLEE